MSDRYDELLEATAITAERIADAAFRVGRRADRVASWLRYDNISPQPHRYAKMLRDALKTLDAKERQLASLERQIEEHHRSLPSIHDLAGSMDITGGLPLQLHMDRLRGRDNPMDCGHPAQCLKQDDAGDWACMVCGWNPNASGTGAVTERSEVLADGPPLATGERDAQTPTRWTDTRGEA